MRTTDTVVVIIRCSPFPCDIVTIPYYGTFAKKLSKSLLNRINFSPSSDSEEMMFFNRLGIRCISDTGIIREMIKARFGSRLMYIYEVDCLPDR